MFHRCYRLKIAFPQMITIFQLSGQIYCSKARIANRDSLQMATPATCLLSHQNFPLLPSFCERNQIKLLQNFKARSTTSPDGRNNPPLQAPPEERPLPKQRGRPPPPPPSAHVDVGDLVITAYRHGCHVPPAQLRLGTRRGTFSQRRARRRATLSLPWSQGRRDSPQTPATLPGNPAATTTESYKRSFAVPLSSLGPKQTASLACVTSKETLPPFHRVSEACLS